MKTKAVALSCSAGLLGGCDAFISQHVVLASQQQQQLARLPAATTAAGSATSPPRPLLALARESLGVRRARRATRSKMSTSSTDAAGDAAAPRALPVGPGAGVIDLKFESLKVGGFKVFLTLYLLGQGRSPENDTPFSVRVTDEGIRVLIGDETKNDDEWDGVLDLSWGVEPRPFFRVDRIDADEVIPYPGELYILNKLLDGIVDVNGETTVNDFQRLFQFPPWERNQLAETKAKLASMAALE